MGCEMTPTGPTPASPRPVGRPPGSKETPYEMVKADLHQTLKLQKRLRGIVESQLDAIEKRLTATETTSREQLEILDSLAKMSETLTRNVQQTAKWILTAAKPGDEDATGGVDEDTLVERLLNQ